MCIRDSTSDVIDALRERFPKIVGPRKDDICYATTNRQEAVRALAEQADVVLAVSYTHLDVYKRQVQISAA